MGYSNSTAECFWIKFLASVPGHLVYEMEIELFFIDLFCERCFEWSVLYFWE